MCSAAATEPEPRTLVLGLGNPILGDDGVGWRVADALERRLLADPPGGLSAAAVEVDRLAVGGLRLMERLVGYDRVVVVDATLDGRLPGTVRMGTLEEVESRLAGHLDSAHDTTLSAALEVGRGLGAHLPRELIVLTISARQVSDFDKAMTPAVSAAVAPAVEHILDLLRRPAGVSG